MYKRDYHPDENIVFKTKNYGFDAPKSTPLEPLSNALVQIDAALKKEETDRIVEDVSIHAHIDTEIAIRESADEAIRSMLKNYYLQNITPFAGDYGAYENFIIQFIQIKNTVNFTLTINCKGTFDIYLADLFINGSIYCRTPNNTLIATDYGDAQERAEIRIYPNSSAIQVKTTATTIKPFCLNGTLTLNA
jgi:hypothetical protein